jgi:hypothetical protein
VNILFLLRFDEKDRIPQIKIKTTVTNYYYKTSKTIIESFLFSYFILILFLWRITLKKQHLHLLKCTPWLAASSIISAWRLAIGDKSGFQLDPTFFSIFNTKKWPNLFLSNFQHKKVTKFFCQSFNTKKWLTFFFKFFRSKILPWLAGSSLSSLRLAIDWPPAAPESVSS